AAGDDTGGPTDAGIFAGLADVSPTATRSWPTTPAETRAAPSTARPRNSSSTFTATIPRELRSDGRPSCEHLRSRGAARLEAGRCAASSTSNGLTFRPSKRAFDVIFRDGAGEQEIRQ